MFPGLTELLLIGCLIELILIPTFKSNTLTPRTHSQTYWPREISHVMGGTISVLVWTLAWWVSGWFNISHFSSINSVKAMSKRTQEDAGEERVTAYSSSYSEWNVGKNWSSQVWKSGEMSGTSTERPVSDKLVVDIDVDSDTTAESDFSLKTHSFLDRVKIDCERCWTVLQKIQCKTLTNVLWFGNVCVFDIGSICIHGKELLGQFTMHQIYREQLTSKQMFEISEQLILEQSDEIFGVSQISWENSPWKQLSLVNDEEVISLSHAKGCAYFQILCYVLERWIRTQCRILFGNESWIGSKIHHNTEHWTQLTENRWNLSGIISQGQGTSHLNADVRDIWTVDVGTIGWDFSECLKSAGKSVHGDNYLWLMMKKTTVSRMQRFMYSQILCQALERWIRTQSQILFGNESWNGSKIHHNTELWTQLTENRWNSSGIFPRIHHNGALQQSPKVHEQNGRTRTIPRTNYLHVDVQWHHMGN